MWDDMVDALVRFPDRVGGKVGRKPRGRHPHQRLTAVHVKSMKKPGRHADGNGLYLVIDPVGAKRWVWRGVVRGRRCDLGLGSVALVSLAEARVEAVQMQEGCVGGRRPPR
jgi:hypothetical protein